MEYNAVEKVLRPIINTITSARDSDGLEFWLAHRILGRLSLLEDLHSKKVLCEYKIIQLIKEEEKFMNKCLDWSDDEDDSDDDKEDWEIRV